ncbi:hypothetical protein N2152v2_000629 [Parachlorella kessleri]
MSWQEYVDDHLLCELPGGGRLKAAAIVGKDGGVWAQNNDFPDISADEVATLVRGLADSSSLAGAIKFGGEKYMLVAGEPGEVLRGKKGAGGVTIKATNGALVIGIYGEGVTPGECNVVVEQLGDYLKDQGI